jgi:toxin ParE1/3/4
MRLVLHPKVYSDIDEIMGYYERVATPGLAEEFYTELRYFMTKAADKPKSFSIRERDIRRANLRRFPYHFLFHRLCFLPSGDEPARYHPNERSLLSEHEACLPRSAWPAH